MEKIKDVLIHLGEWSLSKLGLLIIWLFIYFSPMVSFIVVITVFVAIDYLTGIGAAKKRNEEITSMRRKDSIIKTLAYQATLLTAFLIEKYFVKEFPCLKLVAGFIAYVEVTSIDENIKTLTGKSLLTELINKFPALNNKK